jgi:hypothetical protein
MNIGMYGMVTESSYYSNSNTNHPHHHHHVANNYDMNSVQHQAPSQPSQVYYTSVLDTTYTKSESPYYNNTTEREEIITSDNGLSYTNLDVVILFLPVIINRLNITMQVLNLMGAIQGNIITEGLVTMQCKTLNTCKLHMRQLIK